MLSTSNTNRIAFWGPPPPPFKPGRPHPLEVSVSAWKRYTNISKWLKTFLTKEMLVLACAPSQTKLDFTHFPTGHIRSIKVVPATYTESLFGAHIAEVSPEESVSSLFAYEPMIAPKGTPPLTPFQILKFLREKMRCEIPSSPDIDPYTYLYVERGGTYVSLSQLYDQAQEDHLAVTASPRNSSCST